MNKEDRIKRLLVGLSTLAITFGLTLVVSAAVITVDGDPSEWPGHGDPDCEDGTNIGVDGCAMLATDPAESETTAMNPGIDILTVWGTNDTGNVYFRFDTVTNTVDFSGGEFVRICMNIPSQGPGQSNIGGCTGFDIDRLILVKIDNDFGTGLEAYVGDCNIINCGSDAVVASQGNTGVYANGGTVNEVGVPMSLLGLDSSDDGAILEVIVYFDDNDLPPDDRIPDSGSLNFQIGTGSPTAITLNTFSVVGGNLPQAMGVVALLLLALLSLGFVIVCRQSAQV